MGLKSLVTKYRTYETKELERRRMKKKKLAPYSKLADKKVLTSNLKKSIKKTLARKKITGKFNAKAYSKAIGNPYDVKFPKTKKVMKKIKKTKVKPRKIVTITYLK